MAYINGKHIPFMFASNGAKLLESGEVTLTREATSSARAAKIALEHKPDLFIFIIEEEDSAVIEQNLAAYVAAYCQRVNELLKYKSLAGGATNINVSIFRQEGNTTYEVDFGGNNTEVKCEDSGEITVRIYGSNSIPYRVGTYKWYSYKLWN